MEKCSCGWELPVSVLPVSIEEYLGTDVNIDKITIKTACVVLRCPVCGKGHSFFHPASLQFPDELTTRSTA